MKLERDTQRTVNIIEAYDRSGIRINRQSYTAPVAVAEQQLLYPWPVQSVSQLDMAAFTSILSWNPEIILLGTGTVQVFPPSTLLAQLMHRGVGVEVMTTGAACRSYAVLSAEGRAVAAGLFPLD